jgi:hypothetical protein
MVALGLFGLVEVEAEAINLYHAKLGSIDEVSR